jgi:hypothetical protein
MTHVDLQNAIRRVLIGASLDAARFTWPIARVVGGQRRDSQYAKLSPAKPLGTMNADTPMIGLS